MSPRTFYWAAERIHDATKAKRDARQQGLVDEEWKYALTHRRPRKRRRKDQQPEVKPPEFLHGQLLYREFFYFAGYRADPHYDRMLGNKRCKQVEWSRDEERLAAWENGQTGYPAIDATMRQLKQEGWIHHRGRQLVACFLTRGDLFVHWELGVKTFHKYLLDADWALGTANWQWHSCSRFFY